MKLHRILPVLLALVLSQAAGAAPQDAEPQGDGTTRLDVAKREKAQVDQMNLPPAQALSEQPTLLVLPVDETDTPGATRK